MTPEQIRELPRRDRVRVIYRLWDDGKARDRKYSYQSVSDEIGLSRNQVAADCRDCKAWYPEETETAHAESIAENDGAQAGVVADELSQEQQAESTGAQSSAPVSKFVTVDQRREAHRVYLGTTYQLRPTHPSNARTRVVCAVGDLHGKPDDAIVAALVARKADVYFFGGDIMDQHFASAHPPESVDEMLERKQAKARDDIAGPRALLELLLDETDADLLVMPGNHDLWSLKQLYNNVPPSMWELFSDPLDILVFGLAPRVRLVSHPTAYYYPDGSKAGDMPEARFIYTLGDVLLSHLNFTGGEPGQAVLKLYNKWFLKWMLPLRLDHVRILVHFHVHKQSFQPVAGGWHLLIEPGMGGKVETERYKFGYQGKWSPGLQGFVSFVQYQDEHDHWRTDMSSVDLVAPHISGWQEARRGTQAA